MCDCACVCSRSVVLDERWGGGGADAERGEINPVETRHPGLITLVPIAALLIDTADTSESAQTLPRGRRKADMTAEARSSAFGSAAIARTRRSRSVATVASGSSSCGSCGLVWSSSVAH
jgi:hypothetical protein